MTTGASGGPALRGRPLGGVPAGETVRLATVVEAGQALRARLAAMGLVPGVELRMMKNAGRGPVVVEVKGVRLALGRGITHRIRVE